MTLKRIAVLVAVLTACGPSDQPAGDSQPQPVATGQTGASADTTGFHQFVDPAELPAMPAYPRAGAGKLAVASAGEVDISTELDAAASLCANPSMLMLQAGSRETWGFLVLLQVPTEGDRETVYPVKHVDTGFPEAPASAMGVERISGQSGTGFQGLQGFAVVTRFGDRISGRLQMTIRNINTEDLIQLAASFEDVEVHELPPEPCLAAVALGG